MNNPLGYHLMIAVDHRNKTKKKTSRWTVLMKIQDKKKIKIYQLENVIIILIRMIIVKVNLKSNPNLT